MHRWLSPVILATRGGIGQEDCSSKPAQTNSSQEPILKNTDTKRTGVVAQGVSPA
jgi:hypothetical protein